MSERDLTPDQDEAVRALLRSSRHTEPTPPAVAARLEDVLAGLVAERREHRAPVTAPIVTLASRRRRVASLGLLAAAAAVVGGVAITEVLPSLGSSSDSGSSAGSSSEDRVATDSAGAGAESAPQDSAAAPEQLERTTTQKDAGNATSDFVSATSTSELKVQLRGLRPTATSPSAPSALSAPTCPVPQVGSASQVAITYDGLPGTAVYRVPVAGRQQVDVYLCGEGTARRTVKISTRQGRP